MRIKLSTIEDVNNYINICSKYYGCDIDVKQGKYNIDGKSVLGIFSLNLLEPVEVLIDSERDDLKISFYNEIRKWEVNDSD